MIPRRTVGWTLCIGLAASLLLGAGCAKSDREAGDDGGAGQAAKENQESGRAAAVPQTADAAARRVIEGLKQNRPQAVWEFLPESYQQELNDLVREFAGRMDRELWNESFAVVRKASRIVREKRAFLQENPALKESSLVTAGDLEGLASLLGTLAESEAADLDRLKTFDGGRFLDRTGGGLMDQLAALEKLSPDETLTGGFRQKFAEFDVTLVASEGDDAVVRIDQRGADGTSDSEEYEFVRVEGKWIPRDLAAEWASSLQEYRARMRAATAPEVMSEARERGLDILAQAHQVLDGLDGANSADEFNQTVADQVVGPLLGLMFRSGGQSSGSVPADPAPSTAETAQAVTVIVRARLDEETEEALQVRLGRTADDRELGTAIPRLEGNSTRFEVTPVRDAMAFAKKIDFGRVIAVDEKERTITVELE